jgi:hypothetical protein
MADDDLFGAASQGIGLTPITPDNQSRLETKKACWLAAGFFVLAIVF